MHEFIKLNSKGTLADKLDIYINKSQDLQHLNHIITNLAFLVCVAATIWNNSYWSAGIILVACGFSFIFTSIVDSLSRHYHEKALMVMLHIKYGRDDMLNVL